MKVTLLRSMEPYRCLCLNAYYMADSLLKSVVRIFLPTYLVVVGTGTDVVDSAMQLPMATTCTEVTAKVGDMKFKNSVLIVLFDFCMTLSVKLVSAVKSQGSQLILLFENVTLIENEASDMRE